MLKIKLAIMMALLASSASGFAQQQIKPWHTAASRNVQVQLSVLGATKSVTVPILLEGQYYFPLPALEVTDVRRLADATDTAGEPLVDDDGIIRLPSTLDADDSSFVRVTVHDYMVGTYRSNVEAAIGADPIAQGRTQADLEYRDTEPFLAILEFQDDNNEGRFSTLARRVFSRGSDELQLRFKVKNEQLKSLRDDPASNLRVRVVASYKARFGQPDYELTADALNASFYDTWSKVVSKASGSNVLFINVGGDVTDKSSFMARLSDLLDIKIINYRPDVDKPEYHGGKVDANVVNQFFSMVTKRYFSNVDLSNKTADTVLVFLLHNGVTATTTLGKLNSMGESDYKRVTDQSKDSLKQATHSEDSGGNETGFSIKIPIKTIPLGIDFSNSNTWDNVRDADYEKLAEKFKEDVSSIQHSVSGDLKTVSAMNLEQAKSFSQRSAFSMIVSEISSARVDVKDISFTLPLGRANARLQTETIRRLATDWYQSICRWVVDPAALQPGILESTLNLSQLTARLVTELKTNRVEYRASSMGLCSVPAAQDLRYTDKKQVGNVTDYKFELDFGQVLYRQVQFPTGYVGQVEYGVYWYIGLDASNLIDRLYWRPMDKL